MPSVDLEKVSERLKGFRARVALTQAEVAAELGIPKRTFQSWENGVVETSAENYELLAKHWSDQLGEVITRDWIMFGVASVSAPEPVLEAALEKMHQATREAIEAIRKEAEDRHQALRAELLLLLAEESGDGPYRDRGSALSAHVPRSQDR